MTFFRFEKRTSLNSLSHKSTRQAFLNKLPTEITNHLVTKGSIR